MGKTILACNSCTYHEPDQPVVHFYSMTDAGLLDEVVEIRCHKCHEEFVPTSINDAGIRFYDQHAMTGHMSDHAHEVDKS